MVKKEYNLIPPNNKIKVFISSKCDSDGVVKYNPIRAELKKYIEETGLATVYIFEGEEASTLSASNHYSLALVDSDICIFLIDNADGVPVGVQTEVDIVQKNNIKALYYFCDEKKQEKTALEKSLLKASCAKSKTVHSFSDLSKNCASALIEDIVSIYHHYCIGRLQFVKDNTQNEIYNIDISAVNEHYQLSIPRIMLKELDKSSEYILRGVIGLPTSFFSRFSIHTNELDEWGRRFLPVLFEGKSIKEFNTTLFLEYLKDYQNKPHYNVVSLRWSAIQSYFSGNTAECIEFLKQALELAKSTNLSSWIINDILIDLRNQHFIRYEENNTISIPDVQKELDESVDEICYPIIDRFNESLQENYIHGIYKQFTESPYTVTYGNDCRKNCYLLASLFIVALYNGSLTHIILLYDKVKDFFFYLSKRYGDWKFKRELLKYAIFTSNSKEVMGIQNAYPEILGKLSETEAENIIKFCSYHPIYHRRVQHLLLAFGTVGYYLNDASFKLYESKIFDIIYSWLEDGTTLAIGGSIFSSLSNVSYRLSQDTLANICCKLIDQHYSRWYSDMFKFMAQHINISKMDKAIAMDLINRIISVLQNEKEYEAIQYQLSFLHILRKQNRLLTENLDKEIKNCALDYYENTYKLETTDKESEFIKFIEKYVRSIKEDNEKQGKGGIFFQHGIRDIATIKSILTINDLHIPDDLMDSIAETVSQTLLKSNETIPIKMDAVAMLCCLIIKYPQVYVRNKNVFQSVYENEEHILSENSSPLSYNIDIVALNISLKILFSIMDKDVRTDLLVLLPYLKDNIATTITVSNFIAEQLELSDTFTLEQSTDAVILQNAILWVHESNVDIKWNATRILMSLLRNPDNKDIINRQIISLIDTENVYIKNLILRHIGKVSGITEDTKKYVLEICKDDANFVTRALCKRIKL